MEGDMAKDRIYTTKDGAVEYGYIRTPKDMVGKMEPFSPCWNVQYLGDGTQEFFDTKQECLDWIEEWKEIGKE